MKHITFKKKLIAILSAMVLAVSCPIIAMAEDDYSSASTIKTEASKEKIVDKETVSECMWHETHEMFQRWYDDIERKIKKYS